MDIINNIKAEIEKYAAVDYTSFDDEKAFNWAISKALVEGASTEALREEYKSLLSQALDSYPLTFQTKEGEFKTVSNANDFNVAVFSYLEDITNKHIESYGFEAGEKRPYKRNIASLYSPANWFVAAFILVLDARKQPHWMKA